MNILYMTMITCHGLKFQACMFYGLTSNVEKKSLSTKPVTLLLKVESLKLQLKIHTILCQLVLLFL